MLGVRRNMCDQLSALERSVPAACTNEMSCARAHTLLSRALGSWGAAASHDPSEQKCRVASLGEDLCADAVTVLRGLNGRGVRGSHHWSLWMDELSRIETNASDCATFDLFHDRRWNPRVFSWSNGAAEPKREELLDDPAYAARWERFEDACGSYGPSSLSKLPMRHASCEHERITMVSHFRTLLLSTGVAPVNLSAIVEFGGGTGQLAHVARSVGFEGMHVVYDMPPMLLLHRYWQRRAGMPSYLVGLDGSTNSTSKLRNAVLLVSSVAHAGGALQPLLPRLLSEWEDGFGSHQQHPLRSEALFIATWSFTEAPEGARDLIRPLLSGFGRLLLTFGDKFDQMDPVPYINRLIDRELHAFSVCSWRYHANHSWYMVAQRRELGEVRCLRSLGCDQDRLHPTVHSNCLRPATHLLPPAGATARLKGRIVETASIMASPPADSAECSRRRTITSRRACLAALRTSAQQQGN